jgi:hypothetical protein
MKKLLLLTLASAGLLLFTGCPYGYRYNTGKFPLDPVDIAVLNSIYDDFNMTAPVIQGEMYLYFSSNRNSYGEDFDIVGDQFNVLWDRDEGTLTVNDKPHSWKDYRYLDTLFARMNSPFNELGPYSLPFYTYGNLQSTYTDLVVYSDDEAGNLDLKFVSFRGEGENPGPFNAEYLGPLPVKFLNSVGNDAYLAFYGQQYFMQDYGALPEEIREVYFCSDRDGDFDIYMTDYPAGTNILDFLMADTVLPIETVDILNTSYQDKCPYINGSLLVFTSDRPGGYGGFDLYYSRRQGNTWSEPVNFGDRINTGYNEYRPIASIYAEFEQDLLLFSSDRPGGQGGYDLYFVGIPRMIE